MSVSAGETPSSSSEPAEPFHDPRPWREAGWIFTSDGAITIERQGGRTRVRTTRVSHLREE